ncbi:Alpha/Beta hydrolase protein [Cladochytrium replicatum]|nr:Alpha/Beta hydrolase protein [Cladochytrium replicatum]
MFEAWRDRPWVREQFFEDLLVGAKAGSWVRRVKEYHHHPHSEKLGVQDDGEGVWSVREEERRRRRRPREPFRLLPDLKDPKTVLALGKMSFNSYYDPGKSEWKDINDWDVENRFGWESDGIRGYLFADEEREVVILAIKGTTPLWPGVGGGPTGPRDKMNDNTYFSCCCAKVSWSWKTVCDCANSVNECRADCIHPAVSFVDSYYNLAQTFFLAIRDWYPNSHVWLTGHSLGGALAALVALTNNLAAIAYESPGDLLYAHRLGLLPSTAFSEHSSELAIPDYSDYLSKLPIYHVGNVHDPIYHGKCNGPTSTCWYGGYVLETRCHIGKECIYDEGGTPRLDIRLHGIQLVIQEYLEKWETVPDCEVMRGCEDCGAWKFV